MPSKIAVALAEAAVDRLPDSGDANEYKASLIARAIDERLAEIRKHYEPEELVRCPIVSHHPDPCVGCLCAAMREFILVPESEAT